MKLNLKIKSVEFNGIQLISKEVNYIKGLLLYS